MDVDDGRNCGRKDVGAGAHRPTKVEASADVALVLPVSGTRTRSMVSMSLEIMLWLLWSAVGSASGDHRQQQSYLSCGSGKDSFHTPILSNGFNFSCGGHVQPGHRQTQRYTKHY